MSESQFVYASSFVGKAFALDIDDNIIDSLDIEGNWASGIGAFDAPFYRLTAQSNHQTRRGVGVSERGNDVLSKIADSHKFCL